jgi:hypothetical protein
MPSKIRVRGQPLDLKLRIVSAGWAASESERLPDASLKMRQQSLLDWEFLSQASMLPSYRKYVGDINEFETLRNLGLSRKSISYAL